MLSSEDSTVFTSDDDPELIKEALPFGLKLYESLAEQAPDNPDLLLATGRSFCMYAYAFVQEPSERLADSDIEKQTRMQIRAKKLYLRGRTYILRGLEVNHPGFTNLMAKGKMEKAVLSCGKKDVGYLYWAGLAWMGAYTADKFDMNLAVNTSKPVKMITRALDLDESYNEGAVHEFFISYYGSLPVTMGGSEEKARYHFKRSIELSHGLKASPYLALATSICINKQNIGEFKSLCNQALAVDTNKNPQNRLLNILYQDKARWLLAHLDNYFLMEKE